MTLEFTPLSADVGLAVRGIDLEAPIAPEIGERLRTAFVQAGILVFREGGTSPEAHLSLSRCFGELQRHPAKENWVAGYPELVDISYRPGPETESSVALYEVDGERRGGWLPWHADLMFTDKINRGGILRAITLPRAGGRTGFIDRIGAYDRLPEMLQQRIEGLHVVYQLRPDFTFEKFGKPPSLRLVANSASMASLAARIDQDFPPVLHPMVFRQPETGRKVLNVSPTSALAIHEMPGDEGDALLSQIISRMIDPSHTYFHEWRKNDLVLWDNWRTLHCAEGVPEDCTREMQRTTITGDYALGRKLNEARV